MAILFAEENMNVTALGPTIRVQTSTDYLDEVQETQNLLENLSR